MRHFRPHGLAQVLARPRSQASGGPEKVAPWGQLETIEVPLANPDGVFPDKEERLQNPKWFFEKFSENSLTRFLSSCNLCPTEKGVLLDRDFWQISTNGVTISPPEQIIWSLNPQGRQQIYSTLANSAINYPQRYPFRIPLNAFDVKFKESGLPLEQVARIRKLTYTNSGYLCFTDLAAVERVLRPQDFKDLIETLYVIPTYILRLRISEHSNTDDLVKYWGRGGRENRVAPILSSLARVPGGAAMTISYLLPPFARLRLYTYPESWKDPTAGKQDCFFTAMNFFNETPDTNFFDGAYSQKILDTEYEPVSDEPFFGDLIVLFDESGQSVHMCVYIADDFVFTKNGVNPAQPWVLMRMSDMMMVYYTPEKTARIMFLRRKDLG